MKIPIILLTVLCIVLAGCLTASAAHEPTQFKNQYGYHTGNGYGAHDNQGRCTEGNCGLNPSYYGRNRGNYCPDGNCRNYCPDGNCGNYCPNGNCGGTSSPCPNGNCDTSSTCPDGNCGTTEPVNNSTCPNGNCGTTTEPGDITSINGTTTHKLCENGICYVGGDGQVLTLTNYNNATNPTYEELLTFLKNDTTDEHPYTSQYVCSDFAETLHNNAEKAGLKCAFVGCDFTQGVGHAFNEFETTDKGTVYIDCTGVPGGSMYQDKILNCVVGQPLTGQYLLRNGNIESMGIVKQLHVFQ